MAWDQTSCSQEAGVGWALWRGSGSQVPQDLLQLGGLRDWAGCPPPFRVPSHAGWLQHTHRPGPPHRSLLAFAHLELSELIPVKSLDACRVPSAEVSGATVLTCPADPAHGTSSGAMSGPRGAQGSLPIRSLCCLKKQLQVIRICDLLEHQARYT